MSYLNRGGAIGAGKSDEDLDMYGFINFTYLIL